MSILHLSSSLLLAAAAGPVAATGVGTAERPALQPRRLRPRLPTPPGPFEPADGTSSVLSSAALVKSSAAGAGTNKNRGNWKKIEGMRYPQAPPERERWGMENLQYHRRCH
eukprot:gene25473-biopygen9034